MLYFGTMSKQMEMCRWRHGCSNKNGNKPVPHELVDCGAAGIWLSCMGCRRGRLLQPAEQEVV